MSDNNDHDYYQYDPSLAAAATFAALFGLSAAAHLFQLVRKKTWYFIPFFIGVIFEVVGYGARALNANQTPDWTLVPFILESLLLLLGPALYAASIYMVIGRIIRLLDAEHLSFIRTKRLTMIFVSGDVLSFLTQCAGGGILASADDKKANDLGQTVILVGLAIQILFFGCFVAVISVFHYRIIRQPTATSIETKVHWRQYILILYFTSLLILVRSLFRVAEYALGKDGVLQSSEVYLYCLDSALMLLCAAAFNVWHPSRVVTSPRAKSFDGIELDDSATTVEREAMMAARA